MAPNTRIAQLSNYEVLKEVVKDYPGLLSATEPLVSELEHYPKNWEFIIREIRNYALKNFYLYERHEKGIDVIKTIINIFLEATNSPDTSTQQAAVDGLLFYLEKILIDGEYSLSKYVSIFNECFINLNSLPDEKFLLLVTNPHQIKKLGQILLEKLPSDFNIIEFNRLLLRFLLKSYDYFISEEDPANWFTQTNDYMLNKDEYKALEELLYPVSHANLKNLILHLNNIKKYSDQILLLKEFLSMPGYINLVKYYEDIINKLKKPDDQNRNLKIKFDYLIKILDIKAISVIHENTLREINRTVSNFIKIGKPEQIKAILSNTFRIFGKAFREYPETTLYCIQNIGNNIYDANDSKLVEWFLQKVCSLGFQYPDIKGTTDEWQVKSNRAHLKNIRTWFELIEKNPKWSKSLMSALIINLRLCGTHINDTDVFQKDITNFLNSDITPVYHLVKLTAKLFPVYFSEIGAEGKLREVSTEIDEITGRADILIHFLRKQSHVESSARIVDFIEEIFRFWLTKDKTGLKEYLPEDIYDRISTSGQYIDGINIIFNSILKEKGMRDITDLLRLSDDEIHILTGDIPRISEIDKKRSYSAIKFYQLLYKKYKLDPQDIKEYLEYARSLGLPNTKYLISVLDKGNIYQKLEGILDYLNKLKESLTSPDRYEPIENIFRKRHIAVGIPSIYGVYHERKFDALALTFRLENLANILFEDLINLLNLKFITRATLFEIEKYANLFYRALQLDGISSNRLENTLELLTVSLEVRRFSFSQYIDIFRGFSEAVQDILNTYYSGVFKNNLKQIIIQAGTANILPKYLEKSRTQTEFELVNKIFEQFLREIVASSFGLQQMDNFISRILKTLFEQGEGLDVQTLDLLMSYDPKKTLSSIYYPNTATNDRIHLGIKGYNLIKLASLGIPVPPGFIITTEVFRCAKAINKFRYVGEHLEEGIKEFISELEKLTGKGFGDPENPLLVSVRSGGAISIPGMMISFLNVGINESIVEGLIKQTGKPWFVWDCYRRFLQCWGMSYGMERDKFDAIINSYKMKYKVPRKILFTPDQMKEVAFAYRDTIKDYGIEIIDDPKTQLQVSISQVFESWFSRKSQVYRNIIGISENWGTAVIVQAMVYGNLDTNSGTGVLFTRNPQETGDKVMLWGDFAIGAQGEDIVSGLVITLPISNEQKPIEDRTYEISFEDAFPELYDELLRIVKQLIYIERWGAQEIEFTFEGKEKDKLYILQARDMAVTRKESFATFVPSKKLSSNYVSRGIGVGGGALSGRVVFDLDDIHNFRQKEPTTRLILVRSDTVPDDITHISAADGLLTARGGSTSHAAIIANRLGKTCVVGCNNLIVWENEKKCKLNNRLIKAGDFLSIDGRNGAIYSGRHKVEVVRAEIKTDL
jgi:pyruvate,orthophosphate dikinase